MPSAVSADAIADRPRPLARTFGLIVGPSVLILAMLPTVVVASACRRASCRAGPAVGAEAAGSATCVTNW